MHVGNVRFAKRQKTASDEIVKSSLGFLSYNVIEFSRYHELIKSVEALALQYLRICGLSFCQIYVDIRLFKQMWHG